MTKSILVVVAVVITFIFICGCLETSNPTQGTAEVGIQPTTQPQHTIYGTWSVSEGSHKGTVNFMPSGMADVESDVWNGEVEYKGTGNSYRASYWMWSIDFTYDPVQDTITSINQPVTFKRIS